MNITTWEQLIFQFGGFGILAFLFYLFLRADFKRRDRRDSEYDNLVKAFIETSNSFNKTAAAFEVTSAELATSIGNDMTHHTESIEALIKLLDRMCWEIEQK